MATTLLRLSGYRQFLVLAYVLSAVGYIGWRLTTLNPHALGYSWLVYALEAGGIVSAFVHLYMTWAITSRTAPPPSAGRTVDVIVVADVRSLDVVRRTLRASEELQHPHGTCLVDPSASPELEALARDMGVRYVARRGTAAAGLNEALQGSTADLVAIFDGDHAPRQDFLLKTLGYFEDDTVAFVQTPEDAYNLDSYEHWLRRKDGAVWSEESLKQKVVQPGRDRFNAAILGQSCCVLRRKALDAIGGFADARERELAHTSIRLHKKGFRSVYHNESLAFGLASSNLGTFLHSRVVEVRGGLSLWWREGILLAGGLTWPQRISYCSLALPALESWARGCLYVLPGLILWTGVLPIAVDGATFLAFFVPYFLLGVWAFEETGRGYARWLLSELYKVALFYALAMLPFQRPGTDDRPATSVTVPHCLLSALNLSGVGVCVLQPIIEMYRPLPPLVGTVVGLWAFSVFTLSAWVMASVEQPRRRAEYRFPIPLPVRLEAAEGEPPLIGTVDDISTSGLKMYARFPGAVTGGSVLRGELLVPGGSVHFSAVVASLHHGVAGNADYLKSVGCRVDWASPEDRDRLERLLYGSDLQLQVMALSDRGQTLMDRLQAVLRGRERAPHSWRLWAPVYYEAADAALTVGLLSNGDATGRDRHLLLFTPPAEQKSIDVRMVTRTGETTINCPLARCVRIETALSPLFLYDLTPAGSMVVPDEPATAVRL